MSVPFPTGVVTLAFTDIQGSSDLWEAHRDAFKPILDEHNRLMRAAAELWSGYEVKTEGDAFFIAFSRASDAVQFAVEAQQAFVRHDWAAVLPGVAALRVRLGLHTGEPLVDVHPNGERDYFGPMVNRAARVSSCGHGGQIVLSEATRSLAAPSLPRSISFRDLGEHRLKGVGEERLWQLVHPDLLPNFPPLKTLSPERHNLPLPPTPYVGREKDIEAWTHLLRQPGTRVLTLIAFGGMGKTRSALHLAELVTDDFDDGVWWVDLQEARSGESMVQRIAYHLRLPLQPQPSVREQVWAYLREKRLLLVLDNTEQIEETPTVVNELLAAAPHVRCLVTTRRALELRLEQRVEVPPLPAADAEALFVERARARKGDFARTAENGADIAELCARLEGVPLAIELAASRAAGMTPREMLDRLSEQLRLLQTRAADLPARQRALRTTLDWSYDLLAEEDRALMAQLSVFAGGFSMEAAEAVCEAFDVLEGVLEMVRHSLVRAVTDPGSQKTRYRMFETVRAYAAEKLAEMGPLGDTVTRRHLKHFLSFAEARVEQMRTREEAQALDELGLDFDNIRAAFTAARAIGDFESHARLAVAGYHSLHRRGFWSEAGRWLESGFQSLETHPDEARALRAEVAFCQAVLAQNLGEFTEARAKAESSMFARRELDDLTGVAEAINLLGIVAREAGDLEESEYFFQEALTFLPENDHARRGSVLHNLAIFEARRGNHVACRALCETALAHRRAAGDLRAEAQTLNHFGAIAQSSGDHEEARAYYHQCLAISQRLGDKQRIGILLNNLGELAELCGDVETAIALFVHAERLLNELQSPHSRVPAEALQRLRIPFDEDGWSGKLSEIQRRPWEHLVES